MEEVELSLPAFTVTEDAHADTFPIPPPHREGIARLDETDAVNTVIELMTVLGRVIAYTHP